MQAPRKPWEGPGFNGNSTNVSALNRNAFPGGTPLLHSSSPSTSVQNVVTHPSNIIPGRQQSIPPPVPRRTNITTPSLVHRSNYMSPYGMNNYSSFSNLGGYGGYSGIGGYSGYNSYSGMGGMGGYGGYGYGGYGGYAPSRFNTPDPNDPESRFIQLAEESSRPAFQSIESLVQAFHSISMMLDSTFNAVHMSFRAVLGVAENFGRLRRLFAQFFSSVAIFRAVIWLYKNVLYMLGLRRVSPGRDDLWQEALQATGEELAVATGRPRSSWPILMFMGIVFTGPYLIFKLMSSLSSSPEAEQIASPQNIWDPSQDPGIPVVGVYDFVARAEDEISFQAGQRLEIAPPSFQMKDVSEWVLARIPGNGRMGLIPINHVARIRRAPNPSSVPFASPSVGIEQSCPQVNDATSSTVMPSSIMIPHNDNSTGYPTRAQSTSSTSAGLDQQNGSAKANSDIQSQQQETHPVADPPTSSVTSDMCEIVTKTPPTSQQ